MQLKRGIQGQPCYIINVYKYIDLFDTARDQLADWVREGSLKPYEHVVEGFENMPKAFMDQMEGKSQGKVIVRV